MPTWNFSWFKYLFKIENINLPVKYVVFLEIQAIKEVCDKQQEVVVCTTL